MAISPILLLAVLVVALAGAGFLTYRFAAWQRQAQEDLERALAEADTQRERLVAVLRSVPHGLLVLDHHGTVIVANGQAAALWGLAGAEITGLSLRTLGRRDVFRCDGEPWQLADVLVEAEVSTGRSLWVTNPRPVEVETVASGRVLEVTGTPVWSVAGGGWIGTIVLFRDVTEIRQLERLRENLTTIPDGRWLNLFNVGYIITDKLHDAWLDDVFYDLQFGAQLADGESAAVACAPQFEATALGLVAHLDGEESLPGDAVIGVVEVGLGAELTRTFDLRAGDSVTRLRWTQPAVPTAIVVRATLPEGELVVRGASLIDERTGGFQSLVLSDQGRFRLAHSGDVKIYENLDVLGRAFFVHKAVVAADDEEALTLMQSPAFDPATTVVLARRDDPAWSPSDPTRSPGVRVTHYAPERVKVAVESSAPGYLVLADSWYPGWQATVDGEPAPIYRADLLFRAVAVDAGQHRVVFTFRPASLWIGMSISLVGLIGLGIALSKARRSDIITRPVERGLVER